ncbi:MAG: DNA primase [Oscillospiraceae bacterium]
MAFPPAFLDELNARNPIEDVVGQYVALTRRGSNLFGLCPFHGEKTPSFSVAPEKGIFYCFGCHKGGGVVNFIMEIENLTYGDAVRFLAKRAGLEVPDDGAYQSQYKKKERLWALCRAAAQFYHAQLKTPAGEEARAYLQKRGVSGQTVTRFGLGYSPNRWTALLDVMTAKGYTKEELLEAGLLSQNRDKGTLYDRFRNRLMFPIIDVRGNVIGFGGRVMDDSTPKYLNSPETIIFNKRRNLFAMNVVKKSKREFIILTEGYMDAIALHQYGFDCAVASLGTSLTQEHADMLSKYTDELVLTYDGDEAGQNATQRAIPMLERTGLRVRILRMRGAKDPDEFLKKYGADRFRLLLEGCENQAEYRLRSLQMRFDLSQDEQKVEFAKQAAALIAGFGTAVEREVYGTRAAEAAGLSPDVLRMEIDRARKRLLRQEKREETRREMDPAAAVQPFQRELRYDNLRSAVAEEGLLRMLFREPASAGADGGPDGGGFLRAAVRPGLCRSARAVAERSCASRLRRWRTA